MKDNRIIDIEPNKDYIMWVVDTAGIGYDCVLTVPKGYNAVYYENESARFDCLSDGRYSENINPKSNKRSNKVVKIVAATAAEFDISFAKTGIPYVDDEDDTDTWTEVSVRAGCKLKISNPNILYKKIGKDYFGMTSINLRDFFWETILSELGSLTSKLFERESYMSLPAKMSGLAKQLEDILENIFRDYGVRVSSNSAWIEPYFSDEYREKRKQAAEEDAKKRKERKETREKQSNDRREIEMIKTIISNTTKESGGKKCPQCNSAIEDNAKFCPKCGKKI